MSNFEIVAREDFSHVTYLLEIRHPLLAKAAKPGQFVIVMSHAEGERIPLTIADFDRAKGTITLVIQAVGKTTKEMQRTCTVGTSLYAVVGPMGVPSQLGHAKKALVVGGGLGVAPTFPQARAFQEAGAYVIGVIGFRTKDLIFWEDKFRGVCDEVIVCTDDGSAGIKGTVTEGIKAARREARGHRRVRRDRAADHDEGLRRGDAPAQDQDDGEPESADGRRHRDVRRLPRQDRRRDQVRLRRRARLRRPPGRLRRPDGAARSASPPRSGWRWSTGTTPAG